jgi:membrane protease YdiL (CAAX protease family)
VFWAFVTLAGLILANSEGQGSSSDIGVVLLLVAWAGGAVTSFLVRRQKRRWALRPAVDAHSDLSDAFEREAVDDRRRASSSDLGISETGIADMAAGRRDLWPWVSLLPFGLGSWAPLIAAVRFRVWLWALPGVACIVATISGFVLAGSSNSHGATTNQTEAQLAAVLLIAGWMGGIWASFAIRPGYDARRGLPARERPVWPRPSSRSLDWSPRYAILAFVLTFAAVIVVGLILRFVVDIHVQVGPGVLIVDSILLSALVPLARGRGLSFTDLGVQPTLALRSLWLVIVAFVVYVVIAALWSLAFISHSTAHAADVLSGVHHLGTFGVVVTVIAVAISAPVVEEVFFRGFLYRSLRNRLPVAPAALLAGMLFGLVHITGYPLITLPIKAAFGVLACLLYERTGSILPGIALHSFVDATGADLSLTGNDIVVLIVAGLLAAAILLRALLKLVREPQVPTAFVELPQVANLGFRGPGSEG